MERTDPPQAASGFDCSLRLDLWADIFNYNAAGLDSQEPSLSFSLTFAVRLIMRYWIFKTEPDCFSLADLAASPRQTTAWDGVRNYQARNFMRDDMKVGDKGLFYHSGKNPEVAGVVEIARAGYPDHTAQDALANHFDPAATPENPRWYMVDVKLIRVFQPPIPRALLRNQPPLMDMELLRQGCRLSVLPVEKDHFQYILELADRLAACPTP